VIQRVRIQNFRCVRDATIDLGPLTVLVGPNASGKSTIVEALASRTALEGREAWMHQANPEIEIEVFYGSASGTRQLSMKNGQTVTLSHHAQVLRLDLERLRTQNQVARQDRLSATGDNLANVFGTLTHKQQESLAHELSRLVPVFADVDLEPTDRGLHQLRFQDRWNRDVWYAPNEVSDGTMLMTAFLTLQYQQPRLDLLAIEEPDRGLHPYLVSQLIALLRKLTAGEIGSKQPTQVVLASHSAELLDYVQPEEVRFLNRNRETGAVEVYQVDQKSADWRATYNEYKESLGSVWLSGGLGGVPGG
jgi:predicted ATPase